jgi:hypothetical protein
MLLEEEQTQLELFEENLPHKPYCSKEKGYLNIRSKAIAKLQKYIQHNKPTEVRWLVFDCDYWGALEHVGQNHLPPPNIVATNRANGHSHLFYGLEVPVIITDNGTAKPKAFLRNVSYALGLALESDQGYSNFIAKNPLQKEFWEVLEVKKQPWELSDFLEFLEVPNKTPAKAKIVGVGRNVTLFEIARRWSYRQVLAYRLSGAKNNFANAVFEFCENYNQENFPTPLNFSEVKAIAKSISNWTWSKYTARWTDEQFSQIQARRGKAGGLKSGATRLSTNEEKRLQARSMRSEGMTQKAIAVALGVTQQSVSLWLKK